MSNFLNGTKAVVFDMDGVLVDTMPFHYRAWRETFKKFGIKITKKEVFLREGERWNRTFEEILRKNNIKIDEIAKKRVFEHRERVFKSLFKVKVFKGVEPLLCELRNRNIELGLATGTPRRELNRILPKRIIKKFKVIIPSDELKYGKPHPEPYLVALKKLKIRPSEALVVENAPNGIKSANGAGIRCIAIETSLPKSYLKGAYKVFGTIKELSKFLLG